MGLLQPAPSINDLEKIHYTPKVMKVLRERNKKKRDVTREKHSPQACKNHDQQEI